MYLECTYAEESGPDPAKLLLWLSIYIISTLAAAAALTGKATELVADVRAPDGSSHPTFLVVSST